MWGFFFTFMLKLIHCSYHLFEDIRVKKRMLSSNLNQPTAISNVAVSQSLEDKLQWAIQRIDQLDHLRFQRALSSSNTQFKHVFRLLPLLVHYNIPELPGYVENAPNGITNFEFNHYQKRFFDTLTKGHTVKDPHIITFDALYSMGSIGSIMHTVLSDIDLWLCHNEDLTPQQHSLIEKKFSKIQEWAKKFSVDVNFYLMNPQKFKENHYHTGISEEHSGSAQHFFLLDEFYRSAIRLAGKRLLWLHLDENDYKRVSQDCHFDMQDWIDFGDFSSLSTAEVFGASLWQLYKGIDSPYKSAIKILLLESYTESYPETPLISKQFKKLLLDPTFKEAYHFDPYLVMLEQVSDYLINRKELARLDCLRQCFYLKATSGAPPVSWRKVYLANIVKKWDWREQDVELLNQRTKWKIKQATIHHKMLVGQLLQSYKNLISFARKHHIDPSIMTEDTDILMRKLYSVFEVVPGKVQLLNLRITPNLAEKTLTFIEAREGASMKTGWYLVNQATNNIYDPSLRFVEYNKNLNKLVSWAYFNGILTAETKLHIVSHNIDLSTLRQFVTDLRLSFPVKAPSITNEELLHPNEIRNLILIINLTQDPTKDITAPKEKIQHSDLFNFGAYQQNLVGSISMIYRNMWNEIRTHHFEGESAILNALKILSNKIYRGSAPPQSVNVFCYSKQLRNHLREAISELVHKCISVQTGVIHSKPTIDTLKVAGKTWQFVFNHQQVKLQPAEEQAVENEKIFVNSLNLNQSHVNSTIYYPKEINEFASEGFLQFFFDDLNEHCFNVYILDESNRLESYSECGGSKDEKIKEINKLYSENYLKNENNESFNFPQFYQVLRFNDRVCITPYQSKQHRDFMEQVQCTHS